MWTWIKPKLTILVGLAFAGFLIYSFLAPKCDLPIKYSIGTVDPGFKITTGEAAQITQKAMNEWNTSLGKSVFVYDAAATYKIDFVYDYRQALLDKVRAENNDLQYSGDSIDQMKAKLEAQIASYEANLAQYNADVEYWNARGGAPASEYNRLRSESNNLETRRNSINNFANLLNLQVDEHNTNLQNLTDEINQNKDKVETEGEYYTETNKINIYTFASTNDLELVLMHELGHATGIAHATDPKSIMYYLLNSQDTNNLHLSQEDIGMVKSQCGLK